MSPEFRNFLAMTASTPHASAQQAEAARYALIRRLSPALKHHLVRYLQPIGMIYGVMDHRLSAPTPDLHTLHQDASNINRFAKAALEQCTDISSWLAPEEATLVAVGQGVQECVSLLAASLNFKGFHITNEVKGTDYFLRRDALRCVLSAALLVVTDELDRPADLILSSTIHTDFVSLTLSVQAANGRCEPFDDGYRKLVWSDIKAIAELEDVVLSREVGLMTMSFAIEPRPAKFDQLRA